MTPKPREVHNCSRADLPSAQKSGSGCYLSRDDGVIRPCLYFSFFGNNSAFVVGQFFEASIQISTDKKNPQPRSVFIMRSRTDSMVIINSRC
jgi:hypothetical protein